MYTIDYPAYTITATVYGENFTARAVLKKNNRVLYDMGEFHVPGRGTQSESGESEAEIVAPTEEDDQ